MSNYHSIIHNYGEPQSNFNAELAIKALSYKQDRYDSNAAKIQETLANYGNIDFARPEDRENFYNKINNHIQNIEGLKGADLSNSSITSSITAHISKALDGETMKHVGITQGIRSYQKNLGELQKKDPNSVSETNHLDAVYTSGLDAYMSGESEDVDLNKLVVKPFVDHKANILKKANELKDLMPDSVVQFKNSEGQMVEKTVKTLTVPEWQEYLPRFYSQQDLDQMAINGRARFGWSDEEALKKAPEILEELNKRPQEAVDRLSIIINDPNETEERKERAQKSLDEAEKQITKNKSFVAEMKTATAIGSYFEQQSTTDAVAFAIGREPDLKYVKDHTLERELKAAEAKNQNNPLTDGINVVSGITDTDQYITDKAWYDAKLDSKRAWTQEVNNVLSSLDQTTQEQVKKNAQVIKADKEKDGIRITDAQALQEALFKTNLTIEQAAELQRKYDEHNAFTTAEANAQRAQEASVFSDPAKVKDFYENTVGQWFGKGIQMLGTDVKTYLRNKGVDDVESFQTFLNSEDSQEFRGAVNADIFLSDTKNIITTSPLDAKNLGEALTTDGRIDKFDKESLFLFNRFAASQGEDGLGLTDVLEFRVAEFKASGLLNFAAGPLGLINLALDPVGIGRGEVGWSKGRVLTEKEILDSLGDLQERMYVNIKPGAEKTKTGQALIKAIENKDFSKPSFLQIQATPDSHFYEDETIRKMLSYDENQKEFKKKLGIEAAAIQGMNMITVRLPETAAEANKDTRFKEAQALASSEIYTKGAPFDLEYGQTFRIRENLGEDSVTISQLREYSKTETGMDRGYEQITVSKKLLAEQAPTLFNSIELAQADKRVDFNRGKTKTSLPISYIGLQEETRMMDAIRYTGIGQNVAPFLSKDETRAALTQSFSESIYSPDAPRQYAQSFDLALNNAGEFRAEIVQEGGQAFINLKVGQTQKVNGRNQTTYKDVYKIPTYRAGSSEEIERMLYATPQIFLGVALTAIATDLEEGRIQAYERFNKAIQHLQQ